MTIRTYVVLLVSVATAFAQVNPRLQRAGPRPGQQPAAEVPQQPPGSVEGTVANAATGEPLRRATIMLLPMQQGPQQPSGIRTASTDAGGRFVVTGVPPGTYRINVERNGFVRSQYGARAVNGPGSVVTVGSGQAVKRSRSACSRTP
jgi:hypothetical protein